MKSGSRSGQVPRHSREDSPHFGSRVSTRPPTLGGTAAAVSPEHGRTLAGLSISHVSHLCEHPRREGRGGRGATAGMGCGQRAMALSVWAGAILALSLVPLPGLCAGIKIPAPCQQVYKDCDFFFLGGPKGLPFPLGPRNKFMSPPIVHVKGLIKYAQFYINATDGAPCKSTASQSTCNKFVVAGGRRSGFLGSPHIELSKRDNGGIVRGSCYRLYIGEFSVILGDGPSGRKFMKWTDKNSFFPRDKRCILFQVA